MIKQFLILSFVLVLGFANAQDKIFWDKERKLDWLDFQSKTGPSASKTAATTFCGISYSLNSSTKKFTNKQVKIHSFFVPSKSWAHRDHKTDLILMHEQSHFDIAELFARKFRKAISGRSLDAKTLHSYYEKTYDDYKAYQQQYETATNHGRIRDKQYEYSQMIDEEIERLADFRI